MLCAGEPAVVQGTVLRVARFSAVEIVVASVLLGVKSAPHTEGCDVVLRRNKHLVEVLLHGVVLDQLQV